MDTVAVPTEGKGVSKEDVGPKDVQVDDSMTKSRSDIIVPDDVRRAFAVKIWLLLGIQMLVTGFLAGVFDQLAPDSVVGHDPDDLDYDDHIDAGFGIFIWCSFAVLCFAMLGLLRVYRKKTPHNYYLLALCVPTVSCFWGSCKYAFVRTFSLNLLAISCLSLLCSCVWWNTGVAHWLGRKVQPDQMVLKENREAAKRICNGNNGVSSINSQEGAQLGSTGTTNMKQSASVIAKEAKARIKAENDGLYRATFILAVTSWFIASVIDVIFVMTVDAYWAHKAGLSVQLYDPDTFQAVSLAIGVGLGKGLWFHGDAIWHIRRCNTDEFLSLLIDVNTDIFAVLLAFFAMVITLAFGESVLDA